MIEPENILAVLLVEDSKDDALLVTHRVRKLWPVSRLHCVTSLKESAAYLSENQADVILLDLNLPNGAGANVVTMIRAIAKYSTIIIITGFDDLHTVRQAIQSDADGYLPKSDLNEETLARTILVAVEQRQKMLALQEAAAIRLSLEHALTQQEHVKTKMALDSAVKSNTQVRQEYRRVLESLGFSDDKK
jgi:DNA-binding NarL/FixJ family response regulator